ncbi:MAG: response regulator [Candidatus Hodarchaeales archaeon]
MISAVIISTTGTFNELEKELITHKISVLKKFTSGKKGLDFCLKNNPDLVLIGELVADPSVEDEKITVAEICATIKEKHPKTIIVAVFSLENLSRVLETLKSGASTFFIKPLDSTICMAEIESLLLQKPKILLIDDFVDNLEVLTNFLEEEYEVISASTARKGLSLAIEERPHIVMLDIKLPEISGMTVLRELKKSLPTVSVVMMTAFGNEDIAVDAMKQGASDYITKPFDLTKIKELLAGVVAKRRKAFAEEKLIERISESEKRYSNLISNMTEGVIKLDKEGYVKFANQTASVLANQNLYNMKYTDFIGFDDPFLAAIILDYPDTPSQIKFECDLKVKNEKNIPISLSISKLMDESQFIGSMLVFHDIEDRKMLENQVREYTKTLENKVIERTRELENFVFSVAHDLKSPLRAIEGFSTALLEDYGKNLDDKGNYYLKRINNNAKKLSGLISDLLDYTRIEREAPDLEKTDPNMVLDSVLDDLGPLINQENEIKIHYPDHFPLVIAEQSRLYQIFLNLISNAIKFTKKGEPNEIEIGFEERIIDQINTVVFFVRDKGIGFDSKKFSNKAFAIFQRLHRASDYDGTGVGLAIVKKQIESLNGRIWVDAIEGEGATFYFELLKYTGV